MRSTQTPSNLYFDGYATQVILQNDLGTHGTFFERKQQFRNLSDKRLLSLKTLLFARFFRFASKGR